MSRLITDFIRRRVVKVITDCFPDMGNVPFSIEPAKDKRHGDFQPTWLFFCRVN
ncbi:MAG: hypothetical protein J7J32_05510 [Candidatus Atribacteria bacterium]|nr:hypothetical protein [Candidatus Atribacteria bacterium]MCD6349395.1 hypothetical protein [Candidatus Atribacteria bacterium]